MSSIGKNTEWCRNFGGCREVRDGVTMEIMQRKSFAFCSRGRGQESQASHSLTSEGTVPEVSCPGCPVPLPWSNLNC